MDHISQDIIDCVLKYAKSNGLTKPNFTIEPGSQKGDNFMGIITKLNLEDMDSNKKLTVIVKAAATDSKTREVMNTPIMFGREIWTYKKLIPIFKKIRKPTGDDSLRFSECIEASEDNGNEWLAFEDMCSKGYALHRPRLATLDEVHMKMALKALAEFHALSFVLKEKDPTLFNKLVKQTPDTIFPPKGEREVFKPYLESVAERALNVITIKEHKAKLEMLCHDFYEKIVDVVQPSKNAVFCHGDYWKNNMMFKYRDGVPISVCALDYQILRASSPTVDILYLIFCCSSKEERAAHYKSYLRHYHMEFCKTLKAYEIDHNFSWTEFLEEVKRCSPFAIGMAMMVLPVVTCSADNIPEAKDIVGGDKSLDDSESFALFSERLRGVIEDCVTYGFL